MYCFAYYLIFKCSFLIDIKYYQYCFELNVSIILNLYLSLFEIIILLFYNVMYMFIAPCILLLQWVMMVRDITGSHLIRWTLRSSSVGPRCMVCVEGWALQFHGSRWGSLEKESSTPSMIWQSLQLMPMSCHLRRELSSMRRSFSPIFVHL